ncbi:hypothetical protein RHMOL_Rhmol08G0169900 [Rhododendron molle]|uniref:Uncharacterized protein n=1 Tax=Rhododendron molle TaxID=49168 RepID=A0ACC0MQJ3_RHOML|nr:hypothetical protein RHMOL_Rhmol08G0169900 [Rhododendron molle]
MHWKVWKEIKLRGSESGRCFDATVELTMMMFQSSIMMGERSSGFDRYRDWRLNVDNMSYEELLELGDRIGYVNTGLKEDMIVQCLKKTKLSDNLFSLLPTEMERKCSICQEDYEGNDEVGKLECGHFYHIYCIKQWLMQKILLGLCFDCWVVLVWVVCVWSFMHGQLEHTDFNYAMAIIKDTSTEAHDWLMGLPVQMWARHAFDIRVRSDHITNNLVESFNIWVGNLRGKPVLTLIDNIRSKLMGKLHKRYEIASTWQSLVTPMIRKRLDEVVDQSRVCKITFVGGEEYRVVEGVVSHVVNLRAGTCCCKVWEISGLPCKHAASCISHKRMNIEEFCHTYYHMDTYLRAYGEIIHPLHDETMWEEVPGEPVQAPPLKRLPSRPRKSWRRVVDEPATGGSESRRSCTVRCANCKKIGHNKRTCQRAPVRGSRRGNGSTMRGRGRSQNADVGDPTGASTRGGGIVRRGRGRGTFASTRGRGTFAGTRGRGRNARTLGSGTNAGTSGIGTYAAIINSQSTPSLPLLLSGILNFARHRFGSNNRVLIAESGDVPSRDFLPSPGPQRHRFLFSAPIGVKQRCAHRQYLDPTRLEIGFGFSGVIDFEDHNRRDGIVSTVAVRFC